MLSESPQPRAGLAGFPPCWAAVSIRCSATGRISSSPGQRAGPSAVGEARTARHPLELSRLGLKRTECIVLTSGLSSTSARAVAGVNLDLQTVARMLKFRVTLSLVCSDRRVPPESVYTPRRSSNDRFKTVHRSNDGF